MSNHAFHLRPLLNNELLKITADITVRQLESEKDKFDSIVACGVSMMSIAPVVAYLMNKQLIVVRKENDTDNHSHRVVEFTRPPNNYIVIDDLYCSGKTIKYVRKKMDEHTSANMIGIITVLCIVQAMTFCDSYEDAKIQYDYDIPSYFYDSDKRKDIPILNKTLTEWEYNTYSHIVKETNNNINFWNTMSKPN